MRPVTACEACRSNKRKCRLDKESSKCTRCRTLDLACSLSQAGATAHQKEPVLFRTLRKNHVGDKGSENQPPPLGLQQELIGLYFLHVHDTHHSIFHRPSVERRLRGRDLPEIILYGMMALGARYQEPYPSPEFEFQMADWIMRFSMREAFSAIERRRRGDKFASHARKLLDLTNISVETIQSCILLGTICYADAQTKSEALYYSVAIRLALILDLPRRQCTDEIERQVNLRSKSLPWFWCNPSSNPVQPNQRERAVWSSLYMIDIWSSIGLNLPRQLSFRECHPLPADEETFLSLRDGAKLTASPHGRGLWAEMAVLSQIWAQIHELNKQSVGANMDSDALNHTVDDLARQLYGWAAALPSTLQETAENLQRYTALGLGNAFAALHLGYHYYFEVLFYRFLAKSAGSDPENPSIRGYRRQCEEHALAFCDLLYRTRVVDQCQCLYGMVGHMLVVTSTIYIHILLFSDQEQVSLARQRLALNFEILTDLQSFWATLDVALSRLQVFHNACNRSIDESFRMDQWMLTFILEHGSSVTERTFPDSPSLPGTLQGWYAQEFTS